MEYESYSGPTTYSSYTNRHLTQCQCYIHQPNWCKVPSSLKLFHNSIKP